MTFRPGTLTIKPASVTVKADDKEKTTGAADPEFTATVTGLKNGDDEHTLASVTENGVTTCTLTRGENTILTFTLRRRDKDSADGEKLGEHEIVAEGVEEQGNYIVDYENGILTINKLKITFKDAGGNELRTARLELDQPIGQVDDLAGAEKTGCDFEGWYTEDGTEKVTSASTFTQDTVLIPHYTVTVSFVTGSSNPPAAVTIAEDAALGDQLPEPNKAGCRFVGWYRDSALTGEAVTAEDTFDVHTTLYAKFCRAGHGQL